MISKIFGAAYFAAAFWLGLAPICLAATFGPEIRISKIGGGTAVTARVVAVGATVHAVWSERSADGLQGQIMYARSTDSGTSWSAPTVISGSVSRLDQSPVLAASASSVFVAWTDEVLSVGKLYFRRSQSAGASWTEAEQTLSTGVGFARPTGMLLDSLGRLHLVWYDSRNTPTVGQTFHRLSCDGGQTWFESIVSRYDYAVDNESPRIGELTDGSIYVAVKSSRAGDPQPGWPPHSMFLYRAQTLSCSGAVGTASWLSPPQPVSPTFPDSLANHFGISLAPAPSGAMYLSYLSDRTGVNLHARLGSPSLGAWLPAINLSGLPLSSAEGDGSEVAGWGHGLVSDSALQPHAMFSAPSGQSRYGFDLETVSYRTSRDSAGSWYSALPLVGSDYARYASISSSGNAVFAVWSDWRDTFWKSSGGGGGIFFRRLDVSGPPAVPAVSITPLAPAINFGAQLVGLNAVPRPLSIRNDAAGSRTFGALSLTSPFASVGGSGCTVATSASCAYSASFRTEVVGSIALKGMIEDNAGAVISVALTGRGTYSVADHYYNALLNREGSTSELAYWDGTPSVLVPEGVDAADVYVGMARFFLTSSEYLSRSRTNDEIVSDLYGGLFARAPATDERAYWLNELNLGLPRSAMKASFFTSSEFINLLRLYVASRPSRLDVTLVMRLYRGFLGRIPDVAGLQYWRGQVRQARCTNVYATLQAQVRAMINSFVLSTEYQSMARNNDEFVSDLYATILGRGGERSGIAYWRDQLVAGTLTRAQVTDMFIASSEFQPLVGGINAESCVP